MDKASLAVLQNGTIVTAIKTKLLTSNSVCPAQPRLFETTTNKRLVAWPAANCGPQRQVKEKSRRTHGRWRTKVDQLLLLVTKKKEGRRFSPSPFPCKRIQQDIKSSANPHQSFPRGDKGSSEPRQGKESEGGPVSSREGQQGSGQSQVGFRLRWKGQL